MSTFIDLVAMVSLVGLVCTGIFGAGTGIAMGTLLIVGLIDGPRGGRLEARRTARYGAAQQEVVAGPGAARTSA